MTVALESRMARRMSLAEELADTWCWQPWLGISEGWVVGDGKLRKMNSGVVKAAKWI